MILYDERATLYMEKLISTSSVLQKDDFYKQWLQVAPNLVREVLKLDAYAEDKGPILI